MISSVNNTNQVVFKPLQMTPNFSMHLEDKYLPEINVVSNLKVISMKHTRFDVQQLKVINKEHMNTFGDDIAISIIAEACHMNLTLAFVDMIYRSLWKLICQD